MVSCHEAAGRPEGRVSATRGAARPRACSYVDEMSAPAADSLTPSGILERLHVPSCDDGPPESPQHDLRRAMKCLEGIGGSIPALRHS